jgi:fructokinase
MARHDYSEQRNDNAALKKLGASARPVVVGEVLFDVFPDGSRVLGGAPFNVAWHLQAFGLEPVLVTRVGRDASGEAIVDAMTGWGMDTTAVQVDPDAPTGEVRIQLDDGGHSFDILADQAYDRLDGHAAVAAMPDREIGLLYHGSLIARTELGRSALAAIRGGLQAPVFVDINLRDPWWTPAEADALLCDSRWLKLNDEELTRLCGHEPSDEDGLARAALEFARHYSLEQLVLTRGEVGALVCIDDTCVAGRMSGTADVIDTVGAGDAFSAVWIAGLSSGWRVETTLSRALEFAAAVCEMRGATTSDRGLYQRMLDRWEDS